jgi:carboxypeptidase family protein
MLILAIGFASASLVAAPRAAAPSPRPAPSPAATIVDGTVRGPDAKPVAQARVILSIERTDVPRPPSVTSTDAAGGFHFEVRSPAPFTVRVEAAGLASRTMRHLRPGIPLQIALVRGVAIEGVVRDASRGAPVAGATVEAREEMRGAAGLPWDPESGVVRATTDAKGAYRIDGLASGLYTLTAFARGLGRGSRRNAPAGRAADLLLLPGGTVAGTIVDSAGKALERVAIRLVPSMVMMMTSAEPLLTATDAQGAYALHGVKAGEYVVIARHPDLALTLSPPIAVDRDGDTRADLVMAPPAILRGRLLGTGEKPTRGSAVIREIAGASVPETVEADVTVEAGEDGRFQIRAGRGAQVVEVRAPGYGSRRVEADVERPGETVDLGDIALEVGIAIRGHVRDGAGRPVDGADVGTSAIDTVQSFEARTDAAGAYVLAGLPSGGIYTIWASAPQLGQADRKAEAGATTADLVLPGAGAISGVVMDAAGRPIQGFRVLARSAARQGYRIGGSETFGAEDGRFTLENVSVGEYVVEVTAPDHAAAAVPGIKVTAGRTADAGTVRLEAGGVVRGVVVDAASAPVAGATVLVNRPGRDFRRLASQATTDAGGTFEIGGVSRGSAQVSATHSAYAPSAPSAIEVDPARGPADVRIVLGQGGRIEGRVRSRDGVVPAAAVVSTRSTTPGASFATGPALQPVAADGTFAIDHVPAGRVAVSLMAGQDDQYHGLGEVAADVREGETTAVEFVLRNIAITGKVTRGGVPLAGARVEFDSPHGGMMMYGGGGGGSPLPPYIGITREDGTYQLSVTEPGETSVEIQGPDRKANYPVPSVQVPEADSFVADFNFSGVAIDGVVVDRETEQPIVGAYLIAQPAKGQGSRGVATGESDSDGRFHLEADSGEYRLSARAEGYGGDPVTVAVGEAGATGVRIALVHGLVITGRLVDPSGRGVSGGRVSAWSGEGVNRTNAIALTVGDGSFQLSGLRESRYQLVAAEGGLFALATSAAPNPQPVTLTLRPGGRVHLKVVDATGAGIAGAYASVSGYQGLSLNIYGGQADGSGVLEFNAPAGALEIRASGLSQAAARLEGTAKATVEVGATVAVELTMSPPAN